MNKCPLNIWAFRNKRSDEDIQDIKQLDRHCLLDKYLDERERESSDHFNAYA